MSSPEKKPTNFLHQISQKLGLEKHRNSYLVGLLLFGPVIGASMYNLFGGLLVLTPLLVIWLRKKKGDDKNFIQRIKEYKQHKTRKRLTIIFGPIILLLFLGHLGTSYQKAPSIVIQNDNKTHIGEQDEYTLILDLENADELIVNGESIEIIDGKLEKKYDLKNKTQIAFNIQAKNTTNTTEKSFKISRELTQKEIEYLEQEKIKQAEIKAQQEKEREEKRKQQELDQIARTKIDIQSTIDQLNGFDPNTVSNEPLTLIAKVREFSQIAQTVRKNINSDDQELSLLANNLQSKLESVQQKSFPVFRKKYADYVDTLMRENNIDAKAVGLYKDTLDLVGFRFADNKRIAEMHNEILDVLILLRFERVNYKRSEYSEYQYFDIDALGDNEI